MTANERTVVMTGGTAGFGAVAAGLLRDDPGTRVLIGARRALPSADALRLDLAELCSVRGFATSVRDRLGSGQIDALVLNAGVIFPDAGHRTGRDIETTFAVNYLAHYLLVRLLLPHVADDARILLTTSGTHDPRTNAGLTPPRHADADLLAHPERDPACDTRSRAAGQHAYTASKLCLLLAARSLARHPVVRGRRIRVIGFCPGQVFGTELARDLALPWRVAWTLLGSPLGWVPRRLSRTINSPSDAGEALAGLALGHIVVPDGKYYAALRRRTITWPEPSALAVDDEAASTLWRGSARLAGSTSRRIAATGSGRLSWDRSGAG